MSIPLNELSLEHIKSKHENLTPYKCDQCHRSFGTRSRFRTHKNNVHSRVRCEECNQEICNPFMLKRHKASVHGIQPTSVFHCEYCPLFFCMMKAKEKHVLKHHQQIQSQSWFIHLTNSQIKFLPWQRNIDIRLFKNVLALYVKD